MELLRKFLMSAVVLLFMPETVSQTCVSRVACCLFMWLRRAVRHDCCLFLCTTSIFALIVTLLSCVLFLETRPYIRATDNTVALTAHWAMFIQLFSGLCLQINDNMAEGSFSDKGLDSAALGALVAVLTLLVPIVAVFVGIVAGVGEIKNSLEDAREESGQHLTLKDVCCAWLGRVRGRMRGVQK